MKQEYIDSYPTLNEYDKNIDLIIEKAKKIVPSMTLYKYRSGTYNKDETNYDLMNLRADKIRFTNIKNFNDPFECKIISRDLLDTLDDKLKRFEEFFMYSKKNKSDYIDSAHKELIHNSRYKFFKNLLICSFSEYKDNILMWSHYSNEHKGFCIEYDLESLIKTRAFILPVIYSNEVPDIDDYKINSRRGYSIVYTKALDWEYEKEWRFIINGNSDGENFNIIKPKAIYLGCNIEDKLEKDLLKICKEKNIKCYRAIKDPYKYRLNFEEIL